MGCSLKHRYAKQNAKQRLIDMEVIDQYNNILDYNSFIKAANKLNDYALSEYNIKDKVVRQDQYSGKVVFNQAAFTAIDVLKGKHDGSILDIQAMNYLNQARGNNTQEVSASPAFDPNVLFGGQSQQGTPPANGLTKLASIKTILLTKAKKAYTEIKPQLRKEKDNLPEYNRLLNLQSNLKDYIFGNESKGIQGLENEINEINTLDSRAPEIIAPYIEKEIERLDTLVRSDDPDHTAEAHVIIDFIKAMGDFNSVNIARGEGHPIYDYAELYDSDGNFLLTPSITKPYKDWAEIVVDYEDKLAIQSRNIVEKLFNTNDKIQQLYEGKQFTYNDIINQGQGLKDAKWIDMMVMDISSGIFSHNGLMPQVAKNTVDNELEKQFAWSKKVEEDIDAIMPRLTDELRRLGHGLRSLGIIKGVSFDIFRQKTAEGQTTSNIAQKYSANYDNQRNAMEDRFDKAITQAYQATETNKALKFKYAYDSKAKWLKGATLTVNPALISELVNNPKFSQLFSNSSYGSGEVQQHEQAIKDLVGETHYKKVIESQTKKLEDYVAQQKNTEDTYLQQEGVSRIEDLTDRSINAIAIWEAQNNPLKAVSTLNTLTPTRIINNDFYSNFEYNEHVPLRKIGNIETGFYDNNYEEIEKNPILLEFHDLASNILIEMYERFDYDEQQKIDINSVPSIERVAVELLLDKNLSFYKTISEVFQRFWDKIKGLFGVRIQGSMSFAQINPITGLPDYKVNDSFIQQNSTQIHNLFVVNSSKVRASLIRTGMTLPEIKRNTTITTNSLDEEGYSIVLQYIGKKYTQEELRKLYPTIIPIGKILYESAQHEIAQNKSFDLPKILKLFAHDTAQYTARQQMLPVVDLLKQHYEGIKDQVTTNTDDARTNKETNNNQLKGIRTNANKQFDNWFERVVLGNYGLKKHYGFIRTPLELTKDQSNVYLTKLMTSIFGGTKLDGKIYTAQEKIMLGRVNDSIKAVLKQYNIEDDITGEEIQSAPFSDEDKKTLSELQTIKRRLGKDFALSATVDAIMNYIRFRGLGFNISSGITNFMEGQVANSIAASSGLYFPTEYLHEVGTSDMIASDLAKQLNKGWQSEKVAKAYYLAKRMDALQDNRNEFQKASIQSGVSNLSRLTPFYITAKTEQYNQIPLLVGSMKAESITGKDGTKSNVWDALQGHYNEENKQWEFTLRDNFNTHENKKSWEEFDGQDYFNYKSKLRQMIKNTHGDFDPTSGMMAKSNHVGQAFLTFKSWLPRELYKRFAVQQDDIHSGIQGFKGLYRSHTAATGAVQGGLVGMFFLGPIGAAVGSVAGGTLGHMYGPNTQIGLMKSLLDVNKILFRKMMGMPVNMISRRFGKTLINTEVNENKYNFTQQDFANFKANMQAMATQFAFISLLLLTKAISWDDDDKPEDFRRKMHNLFANRFMQLSGASMMYLNVVEMGQTVLTLPLLTFFKNVGKTIGAFEKFVEGKDTILTGTNAGQSRLAGNIRKTYIPSLGGADFGFDAQMQRQFTPSPYDDYFKGDEWHEKQEKKQKKALRKAELEDQLQDSIPDDDERHTAIMKILNKEFPKAKSHKKKVFTGVLNQ